MNGIESIAAERKRQIQIEGWNAIHDDMHTHGQMAKAAAAYAQAAVLDSSFRERFGQPCIPSFWPWEASWYKPKDPRADLVRAGALIAAEIDRIDRAASKYK